MNKFIIAIALLLATQYSFAQNITVSGYVKDAKTGEAIIGGTVFNTNEKTGTATNNYGFYSITVKSSDTLGFIFSYIGYKAQAKKIVDKKSIELNILLEENVASLTEVVVTADRNDNNVNKAQTGVIDIPLKLLNTLPAIGGEKDILKLIQLLPGVQSGQEGTTGFYVRGGNTDQNLVQLDEATVYNPNHLYGLLSTFNSSALNSVTLIKGGFPAQYGGRLSSILDITMKEGNKKNFSVSGGIGLLTSNISVEGPIKKDKSSFIISLRRSYADLIIKPFIKNFGYKFYDVNAKINLEVTKHDHLFISHFTGLDDAHYVGLSSLNYKINFGNTATTLRWNHLFTDKLFTNTSVIFNNYHNDLATLQGKYYSEQYSAIKDNNFKSDLQFYPNTVHNIKAGFNFSYNTYYPASISAKVPKSGFIYAIKPDSLPRKYSTQLAFYASDDITINDKVSFSVGLRVPYFFQKTTHYSKAEPRITAKFSLSEKTSLKISYTEMNQFLHLIPSNTASLPTDIWISSSSLVQPEFSKQVAAGLFKNFNKNMIETSIEVYYKTMLNQVLFKEGVQPALGNNIDKQLTVGSGTSMGAEFFLKKNFGKLTGFISYTLAKTTQQFDSLNYGNKFPFAYDKRHNGSIAFSWDISKHWNIASDFVFSTGGAYTLPTGRINVYQGGTLYDGVYYDYTGRNNYRYRAYNRLDVNFTYHFKPKKMFRFPYTSDLVFGAYNVYNRNNPYFVYLSADPVTKTVAAKEVSLLPILPSISWNFKF